MTEYASIEDLTSPRAQTESGMPEKDVTLANGRVVRVRGLSRGEAIDLKDIDDRRTYEATIVATGMVVPTMTVEQVRAWQGASDMNEMDPVTDEIAKLSGMDGEAERRAAREMFEDDDAEFRALPGGQTETDAQPTAEDATG